MRQRKPSMGPRFFRSCNLLPNGRRAVTWGQAVLRLVVSAGQDLLGIRSFQGFAIALSRRYLTAFTPRPMAYAKLDNYSARRCAVGAQSLVSACARPQSHEPVAHVLQTHSP